MPPLQHFNCYFLFGNRDSVASAVQSLPVKGAAQLADHVRATPANTTLHKWLQHGFGATALRDVLLPILLKTEFFIEAGSDLDAALSVYANTISGGALAEAGGHLTIKSRPIRQAYEQFRRNRQVLSATVGGIAETTCLLKESGPGAPFVILADPADFGPEVVNINSFVLRAEYFEERYRALMRLMNWWFDLVNWFRTEVVYTGQDGAARISAIELLRTPLRSPGGHEAPVIPHELDIPDLDKALGFLRTRSPTEPGSFYFPNLVEASLFQHRFDLLQHYRAARSILPNPPDTGAESATPARGARARSVDGDRK